MSMDVDPAEVLHLDEFAKSGTFSGVAAAVKGVLRRQFVLIMDTEMEAPVFLLAREDVPENVHGRTLTVEGETWTVIGKQHTDYREIARLVLQE